VTEGNGRPDIQERTFRFALRILAMVEALPPTTAGRVIARQVVRSGTGIGGNVEEAQGAQTPKEFARKMNIARGESLETRYWLRIIAESGMLPRERLGGLIQESEELVRILSAIVKRVRDRQKQQDAAGATRACSGAE